MTIRTRSLFLLILPAIFLRNPGNIADAAPTPTPDLRPGNYFGTIQLTTMHQFSTDVEGSVSRDWSIDMINTTGNIDISISSDHRWSITLDIPLPIETQDDVVIKDKNAKCKGWTVTGSGYGTAKGKFAIPAPPLAIGTFYIDTIEFALSSLSARIRKNGECPSDTWGPELRSAVVLDFTGVFESHWTFTVVHVGMSSMSGSCESQTWGMYEGQKLDCSWRAYYLPA